MRHSRLVSAIITFFLLVTGIVAAQVSASAQPAGMTWNIGELPPGTTQNYVRLDSIAYGDGHYVAVLNDASTLLSTDGKNWSLGGQTGLIRGTSVTYGNGKFVVAYDRKWAVSSDNGATWTSGTFPSGYYYTLTFGNGIFVAMEGDDCNGRSAYSSDGENWTSTLTSSATCWEDIAYANGTFVAVGGHYIDYSPDGQTWTTAINNPIGLTNGFNSVAYGDGKFIAITGGSSTPTSEIYTSTDDGRLWTGINDNPVINAGDWQTVTFGGGTWLLTSMYGNHLTYEAAVSTDGGVTWTGTPHDANQVRDVVYVDGTFVGVGSKLHIDNNNTSTTPQATWWTIAVDDKVETTAVEKSNASTTKVVKFENGSSGPLDSRTKKSLRKLAKKASAATKFEITGSAGRVAGTPEGFVRNLAKKRATVIKNYLVHLGIKKSNITTKVKIVNIGISPKTKILIRGVIN